MGLCDLHTHFPIGIVFFPFLGEKGRLKGAHCPSPNLGKTLEKRGVFLRSSPRELGGIFGGKNHESMGGGEDRPKTVDSRSFSLSC